jgi:hypothetical protein
LKNVPVTLSTLHLGVKEPSTLGRTTLIEFPEEPKNKVYFLKHLERYIVDHLYGDCEYAFEVVIRQPVQSFETLAQFQTPRTSSFGAGCYSPTKTLASHVEKLCFHSDSEVYDVPALQNNRGRSKFSHLSRNAELTKFEEIREMGSWWTGRENERS